MYLYTPIFKAVRNSYFVIFILLLFADVAFPSSQCADTTVRIMTWNLLNFPSQSNLPTDTAVRLPCYRTVIQYVNPDIIVTQENSGSNSISIFLNGVLNAGGNQYSAGTFINGYDTDNGIYYRTSCFRFISNLPIQTALRDVNQFTLVHLPTNDTIHIFSCHLKASPGVANENLRAAEADSIRKVTDAFPPETDFMICGDFNFYGSSEPGYQRLLQTDSFADGNFLDPIAMTGVWNDPAYSIYHTQSTRVRSFGGGASGGLDDRFDLMLFSTAMIQPGKITYQSGTSTPVGNDGLHYGDSINRPPNAVVSQAIAEALYCASDHLPVYADFNFTSLIDVNEIAAQEIQLKIFPNPSGGEITLGFLVRCTATLTLTIYDGMAKEIKSFREENILPGYCEKKIEGAGELPAGNYFVRATTGDGKTISAVFTVR